MDRKAEHDAVFSEYEDLLLQMEYTQELLQQEKERNAIIASFSNQILFEYELGEDHLLIEKRLPDDRQQSECFLNFSGDILTKQNVAALDRAAFVNFCEKMTNAAETCEQDLRLITRTGGVRWTHLLARLVRTSAGQPSKYIGCMLDVHEDWVEREKLIELAHRDPLTQLYNRTKAQDLVNQALQVDPLAPGVLLFVDVDNFKQVNDQFGHYFGDFVLCNAADLFKEIPFPDKIVGRIGGDEFLIMLPGASKAQAQNVAQLICKSFYQEYDLPRRDAESVSLSVSLSVGIVEYPTFGTSYQELMQKADSALYMLKNSGKNRFRFYVPADETLLKQDLFFATRPAKDPIRPHKGSRVDEGLANTVSQTLNRTNNLPNTLPVVLQMLGRHMGLDKVSVIEVDEQESSFFCAYQWVLPAVSGELNEFLLYAQDTARLMMNEYHDRSMLLSADVSKEDISKLYLSNMAAKGVVSFVHYATYSNGLLTYLFQFESYTKPRQWSDKEIAIVREVSNIISLHLLRERVRMQANELVSQRTNYDTLTKLPTLAKFKADAQALVERNPNLSYAVVYSDFKGFKYINDALGYTIGDHVLCDYANLLKKNRLKSELICRVASDIFISLIEAESESDLRKKVDDPHKQFCDIVFEKYCGLTVLIHSGVYFLHTDDMISAAIDNANIARKIAKNSLMDHCSVFDEAMQRQSQLESILFGSLENVLGGHKEFVLYYQPKICLHTRKTVGLEALIRWKREDGTIIPPDQFIPFFEATGMVARLDYYVLESACHMLRRWIDAGRAPLPISTNLSRKDFHHPGAVDTLLDIVDSYNIPHKLIEFEVTESVFMESTEMLGRFLSNLIGLGFSISIDDFGSGYSSLNILSQVPANILKLDKAFLDSSNESEKSKYIIRQIVMMAKSVGLNVICEGVEREDQAAFCIDIGIDLAQGFLFAHPMPEEELLSFLDTGIV